jgi:hypothetical protein
MAIFVPGYGVPEAIRSIRFIPKPDPIGHVDPTCTPPPQKPATLEVWQGDLYGEPTKERLTTFSTSDRTETVYANGEMPVVAAGKSAVAVIHDPPSRHELEFQSEFTDQQGNTVRRTVTLDNYGTACETICELKSSARRRSVASHRNSDVHRTRDIARSLGRFVGRLATSMSSVFKVAPNATQLAAQPAMELADSGLNRPAVRMPSFAPESLDDSGA